MNQFYRLTERCCRRLLLGLFIFFIACQSNAQPVISFHSVASGLSLPVDVVNAGDNSDRIFVVQQAGLIKVFDKFLNPLGDFLNVTGTSFNNGERGLLSLAFHTDYKNNGFFLCLLHQWQR